MELGQPVTFADSQEILEAIQKRQKNFPGEPNEVTLALVLTGIGNRYTSVNCIEGEWVGRKKDVNHFDDEGVPTCPFGHHLVESGARVALGWMLVDE